MLALLVSWANRHLAETMAQNGGVGLPWFERMVTTCAAPELGTRAIPVESVNHLFKSVESRLGTSAIAAWAEDAALTKLLRFHYIGESRLLRTLSSA